MSAHVRDAAPAIKRFISLKGDYDRLRRYALPAQIASDLKNILPPDSCLETSFPKDEVSFEAILFKYYLYPLKVSDQWPNLYNRTSHSCRSHYYLDLHRISSSAGPSGKPYVDVLGAKIFALDESSSFLSRKPQPYPHNRILIGFIIFHVWMLITGLLIWRHATVRSDLVGIPGIFSASYLLGFVAITMSLWLSLLAGCDLRTGMVITFFGLTTVMGLLTWHPWMRAPVKKTTAPADSQKLPLLVKPRRLAFKKIATAELLLSVALTILVFFLFFYIISIPVNVWDEMHIWLLKSKMFYIDQTISFDYTVETNNYYPILWPLNIAAQYCFIGGMYDEVAKWTSAIVFVAFVGMFCGVARSVGMDRRWGWAAVGIYLAGFPHWTIFTALTENIYLALVCMSFFFGLHYFFQQNKKCKGLLIISLLGVSAVKFEGALLALFLVLAFVLSGRGRNTDEMTGELRRSIPLIACLALPICWQLWLQYRRIPFSIYHFQTGLSMENLRLSLGMAKTFMLTPGNLAVLSLVILPLLLLSIRKAWPRTEKFLLIFCIFLICFSFAAGLCWSTKELVLYYPEVFTRLLSRATPFIVLLWVSRISKIWESSTPIKIQTSLPS
ncbi:MAG: hypothetical protein HGA80_05425 [Candidatus Omnitrophica bacterium]|nr:hypothetical protein [Candidatus Omnitrophota bacterium]